MGCAGVVIGKHRNEQFRIGKWQRYKIYPYLLISVTGTRPHQVWRTDIAYLGLPLSWSNKNRPFTRWNYWIIHLLRGDCQNGRRQRWLRLIGQKFLFLKCSLAVFFPTPHLALLAGFRNRIHPAFCRQVMNAVCADCSVQNISPVRFLPH